jgi:hypothetical protein
MVIGPKGVGKSSLCNLFHYALRPYELWEPPFRVGNPDPADNNNRTFTKSLHMTQIIPGIPVFDFFGFEMGDFQVL